MQTPPSPDRRGIRNHNGTLHNPWRPHGKSKLYDPRHLGEPSGNCFHTSIRGKGELDYDRTAVCTRGQNYSHGGESYFLGSTRLVTQPDGSLLVLIWFNETDRYQQLKLDQIQPDNTALPVAPPPGSHNTGKTCLSGCTLLANPSGGILMREVRPDTLLINEKGKQVKVTYTSAWRSQ